MEIDEDLEAESRELLESSDTFEDESELCEQSLYVGHQMDETNNTASENTENVEVKDQTCHDNFVRKTYEKQSQKQRKTK